MLVARSILEGIDSGRYGVPKFGLGIHDVVKSEVNYL